MNRGQEPTVNRWDEVANDIFLDAAEIADDQARARFLDDKCGGDETLKRKVESLLVASEGAGNFLDEPLAALDAEQATALHVNSHLSAGESIGHYKLLQEIGEGGFGIVYMAEQKKPVRRKVALKVVKPGMDTRQVSARFEAERQAVAMMDHPNIAKVFDAGTTHNGRPYFVMELVKGVPITKFCDENQLTSRQRLELFISVCNAVQHAHQKGVIHRDVKPSNIMVTIKDDEPMAKVIDFGVAKAINCNLTEKTLFTQYGQMVGTPQYMSPEQAGISATDLDTRSDIYSLGVLLYELLTGEPPLQAERLRKSAFAEIQRLICEEEAPKPSTRLSSLGNKLPAVADHRKVDPAKLQRDVAGDLDWIVMKSLEKDRNRRYETASGFADDLQRHLNDEPVVARPPSTIYRLQKFARRNKAVLATTAMVAIALLVGTVIAISQAVRAKKAADAARLNARRATEQTDLANASAQLARLSEQKLKDELYASNMNLASEAFAQGDLGRMKELAREELARGDKPYAPDTNQRFFERDLWWRAGHLSKRWARNTTRWPFHSLAVSPSGNFVAAGDYFAGTIHVYDSKTMRLVCNPLPVGTNYDRLRFSPDGRFLLAADAGFPPIRIFDTHNWGHATTLHAGETSAVAFARDQPLLVTGGRGQIMLWDTTSWQPLDALPVEDYSSHLAVTPDGTKLARSVREKSSPIEPLDRIELWDISDRRIIRTLNLQSEHLSSKGTSPDHHDWIAFSPNGALLAVCQPGGVVCLWEVTDLFTEGDEPLPVRTCSASGPIESLAFSPDSTRLAVGTSNDNAILVWDMKSPVTPIQTIRGHAGKVGGVAFVGDSNTLCSSGRDGYARIWDLSDCRIYHLIPGVNSKSHAGYSSDGRLMYLNSKGAIQAWDGITGESRNTLDWERHYSHVAISTNGSFLAGISQDERQLRVWNLEHDTLLHESALEDLGRLTESREGAYHDRSISRVVVSNDGGMVACSVPWRGTHGHVVLVNSEDGEVLGDAHELAPMEAWAAFSPSNGQVVTHDYLDTIARLSDVTDDSVEQRREVPCPGVGLCAAFSPDGDTLAVGGGSRDIRLHDLSGKLIQTLKGHTQAVTSVAFSRNGDRLISSGRDGTVRIWVRGQAQAYRLASTLRGKSQSIQLVAVSPTCNSVAAVNRGGSIQVWQSASQHDANQNIDELLVRAEDMFRTDPRKARKQLDDVVTRAPEDLRARILRGRLFDRLGEWRSAVADWSAALLLDPENHYFLQSRAKAHALGREWKQAVADWDRLVQLTDEANGEYLLGRGECFLHMGRRDAAQSDLKKALTRTASIESVERIVSLLSFDKSVVPPGSRWRFATGSRPPRDWQSTSLDDSDWRTGWAPFGDGARDLPTRTDWGTQDVWLRKTVEVDSQIESPLIVYLRADGEEHVEVYINGVLAASVGGTVPSHQYRRVYEAVACSSQVRLRPGKNVLAVHCQNQRRKWQTYVDVGLYVQVDPAHLDRDLVSAAECASENAEAQFAIGWRYMRKRNWDHAAAYFRRAAKISPERDLLWIWAAIMYCHSGNSDGIDELTDEIVDQFGHSNSSHHLQQLAIALLLGRPEEANLVQIRKLVDRSLKIVRSSSTPVSAGIAKALVQLRSDDHQGAIESARELIASIEGEDHSSLHHRCQLSAILALAHLRIGEIEQASDTIAKVNESFGDALSFHTKATQRGLDPWPAFSETLFKEVKQKLKGKTAR